MSSCVIYCFRLQTTQSQVKYHDLVHALLWTIEDKIAICLTIWASTVSYSLVPFMLAIFQWDSS